MHKRHYLALALIVVPVLAQAGDSRVEIGTGLASYYGAELSGNRTASGERFDPNDGGRMLYSLQPTQWSAESCRYSLLLASRRHGQTPTGSECCTS